MCGRVRSGGIEGRNPQRDKMGPDRPAVSHSGLWCPAGEIEDPARGPGRRVRCRPSPSRYSGGWATCDCEHVLALAGSAEKTGSSLLCWCWLLLAPPPCARARTDGGVTSLVKAGDVELPHISGSALASSDFSPGGGESSHTNMLRACGGWTRSSVDMDAHATTDSSSKLQATSSGSYLQFNTRSLSRLCFGSSMMLAHLFLTTFFPSGLEHYSVSLN